MRDRTGLTGQPRCEQGGTVLRHRDPTTATLVAALLVVGVALAGAVTAGTNAAAAAGDTPSPSPSPSIALEVDHNGTLVKQYSLADLENLTPFYGYAGFINAASNVTGPDAVSGVKISDLVQEALGTPLEPGQSLVVHGSDGYQITCWADQILDPMAGFAMFDATTKEQVFGLTGLAAILIYDDPLGQVMPASDGPLRFVVADAAEENAVMLGSQSIDQVTSLDVRDDTTPPTTTLIPATKDELGYWNNTACRFTFSATDGPHGSGVAETQIDLDGHGWKLWQSGIAFTVPALATHANDGSHTFLLRSTDVAGNTESPQTFSFAIDTRRPSAQTPDAATVRRGSYAALKFKALDSRPCYGSCQVVITVKTAAGKRRLTFSPSRWYKCGKLCSYHFRCKLARGRYRFSVTAWDGAGNRSAKAASNYLTVD